MTDQELLSRHARHPSHAGDPAAHALFGKCSNPLCGDQVDVGVTVIDDVISAINIRANGCGISTASASLMTESVDGLQVDEALRALELFNASLLAPITAEWPAELPLLAPFKRLRESPTRVPCALIGWFALKDALGARKPSVT